MIGTWESYPPCGAVGTWGRAGPPTGAGRGEGGSRGPRTGHLSHRQSRRGAGTRPGAPCTGASSNTVTRCPGTGGNCPGDYGAQRSLVTTVSVNLGGVDLESVKHGSREMGTARSGVGSPGRRTVAARYREQAASCACCRSGRSWSTSTCPEKGLRGTTAPEKARNPRTGAKGGPAPRGRDGEKRR